MYTSKQLRELHKNLPEDKKNIITSFELSDLLGKIADDNNLNIQQKNNLEKLVSYTLLGAVVVGDFESEIKKQLALDQIVTSKIANEVKVKVLDNIEGLSKEIYSSLEYQGEKDEILQSVFVINKDEAKLKIKEIVQKYSLNNEQSSILENTIVSGFINNLEQDLNISPLLASQIRDEINDRIFKKNKVDKIPEISKKIISEKINTPSTSLEIPPVTLPAIEPGQTAHTTPAFSVPPKSITSPVVNPVVETSVPVASGNTIHHLTYAPAEPLVPVSKPVPPTISTPFVSPVNQSKVSVPRYIAPADDEGATPLNAIPHNLPGEEVTPIEKKYVADPYREALN